MEYTRTMIDGEGNCSYDEDEVRQVSPTAFEKYPVNPYWSEVKIEKKYGQRATKVDTSHQHQPNSVRRVPHKAADRHTGRSTRSSPPIKNLSFTRIRSEEQGPGHRIPVDPLISRVPGAREPGKTVVTQNTACRTLPSSRFKTLPPTSRRSEPPARRALRSSLEGTSTILDPVQQK